MKDLSKKWALITGASRGVGQQISLALAKRGCSLILHARKEENLTQTLSLIEEDSVETKVVGASLDTTEEVQTLIDFVVDEIGSPDIIYNNAGIQNEWVDTYENGMDVWHKMFQVNFFSVVQICNIFLPKMIESGYGRIINVTSDIEGVPEMASYGSAKVALRKMSSELAYTLEGKDVTITAMDPGWLRTDLGGPDAPADVTSIIPGALAPILTNIVKNGTVFQAQELQDIEG